MTVLENIQQEVTRRCSLRQHEVINKAIVLYSTPSKCPNCHYLENKVLFSNLFLALPNFWCFYKPGVCSKDRSFFRERYKRASPTYRQLKEIWPCETCMALYNPTGRKRDYSTIIKKHQESNGRPQLEQFIDTSSYRRTISEYI